MNSGCCRRLKGHWPQLDDQGEEGENGQNLHPYIGYNSQSKTDVSTSANENPDVSHHPIKNYV
jgi:hypothetical protein